MKKTIRFKDALVDQNVKEFIAKRIEFSLGRFASRIDSVAVRVGDLNGPRGGIDQFCHLIVSLHGHKQLVVKGVEASLWEAIDLVFGRMSRLVGIEMEKLRLGRLERSLTRTTKRRAVF